MSEARRALAEKLEGEIKFLKTAHGRAFFSENGPASFALVKALIAVVEEQSREIEELKEKLGNARIA